MTMFGSSVRKLREIQTFEFYDQGTRKHPYHKIAIFLH